MDINTLPKGHIIGWAPPPTNTSTSGSPLSKRAKKNAKKKNKCDDKKDEKRVKGEDVPENWEDDGNESGPQGSNSGTSDTNPPVTTTDLESAKENQLVSPADVESDLSSKLDKLNVK